MLNYSRLFRLELLSLGAGVLLGLTACQKSHNGGGGLDGGGGHVARSTPAEVRAAIKEAFELTVSDDERYNIFLAYNNSSAEKAPFEAFATHLSNPAKQFSEQDIDPKNYDPLFGPSSKNYSSFTHILQTVRVIAKKNGGCPSPQNDHPDASVSEFNNKGTICFSIQNLTRIAPANLQQQVLGLLLHETAHLNGWPERQAMDIQDDFTKYFAAQYGEYASWSAFKKGKEDYTTNHYFSLIDHFLLLPKPDLVKKFAPRKQASYIIGNLRQIPHLDSPLEFRLALKAKRWELADVYFNSVYAMVIRIGKKFNVDIADQMLDISTPGLDLKENMIFEPNEAEEEFIKLGKIFESVKRNYQAAVDGTGEVKCLLPDSEDLKTPMPAKYFSKEDLDIEEKLTSDDQMHDPNKDLRNIPNVNYMNVTGDMTFPFSIAFGTLPPATCTPNVLPVNKFVEAL
jgi:hypothetical protein